MQYPFSRLKLVAAIAINALALAAHAQQTLTVAAFPATDEIVKSAIPEFKKKFPNVDVKVVSRQFADHHTAMTTALSAGSNLPDVMVLEVDYVGRFAQGSGLDVLSKAPYNAAQYKGLFVKYAFEQGLNEKGEVVALPTDIGPGTLLYRNDILTKAGVSPQELNRSWESYVASGAKIKDKTGAYLLAHARDIKDIVIRTGIKPGEGMYFDKDNNVLVTSARFQRGFELARQVRQQKLDAKVNTWSPEWTEGLKRGTLATQLSGAWLAGHLNNWIAPDTKGQWRAGELPSGASAAWGGSFMAIPKNANPANKAMAWELIKFLTLDKSMQLAAFKAQDAFPALLAAHDDPFFNQPIAFLGNQQARSMWRTTAGKIAAVKVHKQDAYANEVLNAQLDQVLDQGKDINAALADAKRLIERRAKR